MADKLYKTIDAKINIVNIFIIIPNCVIDNPIVSVVAVKDRISGAQLGHAEIKNDGRIARYPCLLL